MKRSFAAIGAAAVVVIGVALVPSARSAAVSALAVFRVQHAKTIDITVADITELATNAEALTDNLEALHKATGADKADKTNHPQPDIDPVEIASPAEFTAIDVTLPPDFLAADPEFFQVEPNTETFPVEAAKLNPVLEAIGSSVTLDPKFDADVTVTTPPVFAAHTEANAVIVAGAAAIDAPAGLKDTLHSVLDAPLPWLPEHLRTQLAAIDPDSRDVYLPVIVGFGREADIGGKTGYLYSAGDLSSVIASLPSDTFPEAGTLAEEIGTDPNATVLVWVDGGAIVLATGDQGDGELLRFARGVSVS
jgi:hypothetical protein